MPRPSLWPLACGLGLLLSSCQAGKRLQKNAMPEPSVTVPAHFDWQGHRGARGLLPENSLPAFKKALELGVQTLELDLAVSKDGQLIVSHEPWMSHLLCSSPEGQPIAENDEQNHALFHLTVEQIRSYDCGSRGNARFPRQQPMRVYKPTLREVVETCEAYARELGRPLPRYNIEIKSRPEWDGSLTPEPETFARLTLKALQDLGIAERACVQSFDVRPLQILRRRAPTLTLALLVENHEPWQENIQRLGFTPEIYSPFFGLLDEATIQALHEAGMKVIPWTVNSLEDMRRLIRWGVDGIITDYPDLIAQFGGR